MSQMGYRVKKTPFFGLGVLLQIVGLLLFFGLVWFFPVGTIIAFVLGPACFLCVCEHAHAF